MSIFRLLLDLDLNLPCMLTRTSTTVNNLLVIEKIM
jgi:hypothetical protein